MEPACWGAAAAGGAGTAEQVVLAVTNDVLVVAWHDDRHVAPPYLWPHYGNLYYQFVDARAMGRWMEQDFRIDSTYGGIGGKTDLQLEALGQEWYAAWTDHRGDTLDVHFQYRRLGEEAIPPRRALLDRGRGCARRGSPLARQRAVADASG